MSDAQPIDPERFALALQDLPVDALYSKVAELSNSIAHLHSSNTQMLPFAEEGDQDCKDAMFENLGVIGRMNQRIQLIKAEVGRRGLRWTESELEEASKEAGQDLVNGHGGLVNGDTVSAPVQNGNTSIAPAQSGSLTDEQLRERLQSMIEDEEDGVHL